MIITAIGVPMVENILTFMGHQKLGINYPSFVKVPFILELETCSFLAFCWLELLVSIVCEAQYI